jgi:hypothetical protein
MRALPERRSPHLSEGARHRPSQPRDREAERAPIGKDGKIVGYRQNEICFSIEIIPNPIPGGPRG